MILTAQRLKKERFRTTVVRKITQIPADQWGAVFPDVLEGYYFLKTFDEAKLDQFEFLYICVYQDKKLVGAVPCFMTDYSLDTSINGPLRRLTNAIKRVFPDLFCIRTLACGIPTNQGHIGIIGDPKPIVEAVMRRMEMIARREGVQILAFKDFGRQYDGALKIVGDHDFIKMNSLPDTELKLEFRDLEGYLKKLGGSNRSHLRRKFKKADGRVTMEVYDALDDATLSEAYGLYLQVVDDHDMGFETLTLDFFKNAAINVQGRTKYFLWRVDGKMAAFSFCLVGDAELIDYFLGLDYALAKEYSLYFIRFRDVLQWCLERGVKKYMMGCTGYEPKRRLGFAFVPLSLYVHFRFKPIRPLFKLLVGFLKFENFDPELKLWLKEKSQ